MKVIDEVQNAGGQILSFSSVCGGLPAPEAADNPLAYKFSWRPQGVLMASQNAAKYRHDGKLISVPGDELLSTAKRVHFLPSLSLEELPNRDSLPYADIYGIPEARSIFRGTLRYAGFSKIMYQCKQLGLLDSTHRTSLPGSWNQLLEQLVSDSSSNLILDRETKDCLRWLGLYSSDPIEHLHANTSPSIVDSFCARLEKKLSYAPGERDMAVMHHEFDIELANKRKEKRTSTYIGYGSTTPGDTIMAKTVGITAALGVELILTNALTTKSGVLVPTTPDIYEPCLKKLAQEDIHFIEKTIVSSED